MLNVSLLIFTFNLWDTSRILTQTSTFTPQYESIDKYKDILYFINAVFRLQLYKRLSYIEQCECVYYCESAGDTELTVGHVGLNK